MSTKYIYICDHCGAECTDKFEFSLFGRWARKDAQFIPDNVHGCTREHAILAVAKILGIGVDGQALEAIEAQRSELQNTRYKLQKLENANEVNLAQIESLTKQRDEEHGLAQFRATEIDTWKKELTEARERIAELETRPDAAEALQRVRERIRVLHAFTKDDQRMKENATNNIDAEIASLTGPKKPTKPVVSSESLRPFLKRIGFVMKEWQKKSSDHDKHSIDVRNAYSECVDALEKELRVEDPKWCHACLNTGHNPLFVHNNCQYCAWKREGK